MKNITIWAINKIKRCTLRIFEAEDDEPEYVNRKIVAQNNRAIDHYLRTNTPEEKQELLSVINWTNDRCVEDLIKLGWRVWPCNKETEVNAR